MKLEDIRSFLGEKPWQEVVDPYIFNLIEMLNSMPGCATIASCAGAGLKGHNRRKKHTRRDKPYLYMVCRDATSMFLIISALRGIDAQIEYDTPKKRKTTFHMSGNDIPTISVHFKTHKHIVEFERHLILLIGELEIEGSLITKS